jgi:hypothetical protein
MTWSTSASAACWTNGSSRSVWASPNRAAMRLRCFRVWAHLRVSSRRPPSADHTPVSSSFDPHLRRRAVLATPALKAEGEPAPSGDRPLSARLCRPSRPRRRSAIHPEPTKRAGTKRQISSTRVCSDKFFAGRQNFRRSEPSRLPRVGRPFPPARARPTILLDLRSDTRPLMRIFRGMNSG